MTRVLYQPRPVGPRDVGESQRSMHALRRDGQAAIPMWPPICGWYERPWIVRSEIGPVTKRWIPIMITHEISRDPETNETLDRSPQYRCWIDGAEGRIEWAWPECSGRPITEAAYVALLRERDADDGFSPSDPWEI